MDNFVIHLFSVLYFCHICHFAAVGVFSLFTAYISINILFKNNKKDEQHLENSRCFSFLVIR